MSEMTVWVRARFSRMTIQQLGGVEKLEDTLETLLRRCAAMRDAWQDIRLHCDTVAEAQEKVSAVDPDLYKRMELDEYVTDYGASNVFAGKIPSWDENTEWGVYECDDSEHTEFHLSDVLWSMADLGPFVNALRSYGATWVGTLDENTMDVFDVALHGDRAWS